jgi:hypothetical protein
MPTSEQVEARLKAIAGSPDDKAAYMRNLYVPHRTFDALITEVRTCMTAGTGLTIMLIVGPPGAGKTTFGRYQLRELLKRYMPQIREKKGLIPAVFAELDPVEKNKELNWTLIYSRLCNALLTPSPLDGFTIEQTDSESHDMYRQARLMFEAALKGRGLRHLILDEVAYLTTSSTEPYYYGELLKSLANRSRFNLLLLGAYGSEKLAVASGPLARRVIVLEYPRYKANDKDFKEYCEFVAGLCPLLPYNFAVDVEKHQHYLFEGSVGLPGATVDIIKEACSRCDEMRFPKWNEKFLKFSMPSLEAHKKLLKTTLVGEMNIQRYLRSYNTQNYTSEDVVASEILAGLERDKGD